MNANTMTYASAAHAPARWRAPKRRLVGTLTPLHGLFAPTGSTGGHDIQNDFFVCRT